MNPCFLVRGLIWALAVIAVGAAALAQNAPAARAAGDEVVTLSEFTVRSDPPDSYVASETVTGSRVAEKIRHLPYAVNVLTAEFFEDFGFYDFGDDFAYASSFGGYDTGGGGANVRGLAVGKSLRNGFLRIGVVDRANIDRIEIIKGPSAAVYGEALPSGLINIVTKKPQSRPGWRVALAAGANHLARADLEATGPLGNSRTSYLVNASYFEQGFDQPFAQLRTKVLSAAVAHRFAPATSLTFEAEYIDRHNNPVAYVPVARRTAGGNYHGRLATEIAGLNWYGPAESTDRTVKTVTATLEHRFNATWSMRAAANWFDRDVAGRNNNVAGGVAPHYQIDGANAGRLVDRLPAYGFGVEGGRGFQADLTARYWLASRALENRTLLTFDYSGYSRSDPQWRAAAGTALTNAGFARIMDPRNPNYTWPTPEQFPTLYTLNRWNDNATDIYGLFLRHQTAAWGGRALFVGGLRYDFVREDLHRETEQRLGAGPLSVLKRTQDHLTPNLGVNAGLLPGVRAYVNFAETFFVNSQTNSAPVFGGAVDPVNEGGYGWDYGFKAALFEEKLAFTLGGFYIVRENIRVADENGDSRRIGRILSRGIELDANWAMGDGLTVLFGGGLNRAAYTEAGQDLDQVGRQMSGVPKESAYLALRKAWKTGVLRGFKASLGLTYTGETHPFADRGGVVTRLPDGTQAIVSHSGYRDILIPAYVSTRAGISYGWRRARLNHTLGVNVTNVLDADYVERNRRVVESRGFSLIYAVKL